MRPRKYQKDRILDETRRRFFKFGFSKVSVDSIVKELRISKSTVYEYFPTKDDLVKEVVDQVNSEINRELNAIVDNRELSFCSKLSRVIEFTRKTLSMVGEDFLNDLKMLTPEIWRYYESKRKDRVNHYYRRLFENGIHDGHLRNDVSIEILLAVYLHLTQMTINSDHFVTKGFSNRELYDEITRLFLEGALNKSETTEKQIDDEITQDSDR